MNSQTRGSIPCTVGILTFNSENFLERCLKGLSDFSEVLISDGGSTDATLDIAKHYGCRIIAQSNPGHPITDFALERNRMLDASVNDWFLSLDSDELITPELVEDIRKVTGVDDGVYIYRVPYRIVSEDLKTIYGSFKTYYQHRFFNKKSGARYTRKVHERITFDENTSRQGTLTGCWHVPLDIQLDFSIYKQKVDHRIRIMVAERPPKNGIEYLRRMTVDPARNVAKQLIKLVWLRAKYPSKELTPLRYEAYKLYSQLIFMKEATRQYANSWRMHFKFATYALAYAIRGVTRLWNKHSEVTVLMYHAVDDSGGKLAVPPNMFERQLEILAEGYDVVSLEAVVAHASGQRLLTKNSVAITFDDAYRDILTTVAPLLRKYRIPATVFVPTIIEAATDSVQTPRLSWVEIREVLHEGTISFESHGRLHRPLPALSDKELEDELSGSMQDLKKYAGIEARYFAYPYGARDERSEGNVAKYGYEAAFGITQGIVSPGDDLYRIHRVQVDRTITKKLFKIRLTRAVSIQRWLINRFR